MTSPWPSTSPPAAVIASSSVQRPEYGRGPGCLTAPISEIGRERNSRTRTSTEARCKLLDSRSAFSCAGELGLSAAGCRDVADQRQRQGAVLVDPAFDVELRLLEDAYFNEITGADAVGGLTRIRLHSESGRRIGQRQNYDLGNQRS